MTNLKSQHEIEGGSFSSNNSDHSSTSVQSMSPRTTYAGCSTASARNTSSVPPSVVGDGANQFSPDQWVISPEERALMTNSAHFARDRRRRRTAIQLEAPLKSPLHLSSSPPSFPRIRSPVSPVAPHHSPVPDGFRNDGCSDVAPSTTPDTDSVPPRGRLQRSFTPSERKDAGPAILPGLLRRLGRPFSGPWRGPSSLLTSIPATDTQAAGSLSRLRRMFSRRRRG
ncbi:hypothetical protein KCU62_g6065, partial [Aureobasidium sp. EXF-3399]